MTYQKKWKFLRDVNGAIKSNSGDHTWEIGKWYTESDVMLCASGFHSSDKIGQAFGYVQGEYLARVEVTGDHVSSADKHAHESMRLVTVYRWTKQDSVALAVYAARLVLDIFETNRPGDDRVRKAIEAAEKWLENPTAADAAYAAANAAAYAAADAAYAAANAAAYAAAYAAYAAANAAAYAAAYAAANAAAYAAADAEISNKIEAWFKARLSSLEKVN